MTPIRKWPAAALLLFAAVTLCMHAAPALASSSPSAARNVPVLAWSNAPVSEKHHVQAVVAADQADVVAKFTELGLNREALCAPGARVVVFQQEVHAVDLLKQPASPVLAVLRTARDDATTSLEIAHAHADPAAAVRAYLAEACIESAAPEPVEVPLPAWSDATDTAAQVVQRELETPAALWVYGGHVPAASLQEESVSPKAAPAAGSTAKAPLIAKYHVFTPGLFMTLAVTVSLVLLLVVALSWLGSVSAPAGMEGSKRKQKKMQ
ncbi:hypothetical protein GGF31_005156 [Allomyces arbusculus]|nr:hypothetical protein GGF31_005156 [Allomyces arbusculus]